MATNTNALYDPHERIHALATTDRPPSRNLIISPNLVAALEFDERIRRSSSPTPPSTSGLPPPPRARKPTNPAVRIQQKSTSATLPTTSSQPLQHIPSNLPSNPSAWNPYINPKPFFPGLMSDEPAPRLVPASAPSSPVAPATYTFTPLRAPSFGAQQGSAFAAHRAHRRYLSALPKVEWNFFGKSVGSNGKKIENLIVDERHGSSGGFVSSAGPDMKERQHKRVMTVTGSVMATTTSSPVEGSGDVCGTRLPMGSPTSEPSLTTTQAPSRPRAAPPAGAAAVARATCRAAAGTGGDPEPGRDVGPERDLIGGATPGLRGGRQASPGVRVERRDRVEEPQPSLALYEAGLPAQLVASPSSPSSRPSATLSSTATAATAHPHPPPDARMSSSSSYSSASFDIDRPGRISISSTAYPGSSVDHFDDSHFHHQHQPASRPSMTSTSPDHESFIDFASPVSSPRSPDFPHDDDHARLNRVTSIGSSASFSVNPKLYKQKSKDQELPSIFIPLSKPPLPTAPKPDFSRRSLSLQPHTHRSSSADSARERSPAKAKPSQTLPPTTTFLNPRERADRVRQNRKLTQVFGQTPGNVEAIAFSQSAFDASVSPSTYLSASGSSNQASTFGAKKKHQRGAASFSVTEDPPPSATSSMRAMWPPPETTLYLSLNGGRRYSSPNTAQDFTLPEIQTVSSTSWDDVSRSSSPVRDASDLIEVGSEEGVPQTDWSSHDGHVSTRKAVVEAPGSPTSFMDLSDEEGPADSQSIISVETPKVSTRSRARAPFGFSTPSIPESLSPSEEAEEERRRKREKVARLHRFLGSRVPADLVLAQVDTRPSTPPSLPPLSSVDRMSSRDVGARMARIRRRRSSSAAELGGTWSDDIDRLREDLNEREKAINVRRAVKMEKMFGVAPPQTLYHTRHKASPSTGGQQAAVPSSGSPKSRTPPQSPITAALRNLNQTAYSKVVTKKNRRPGTADSSEPLIKTPESTDPPLGHGLSDIYLHYRHSLNSLNDIIDRDDRESLADLHEYLHGSAGDASLQQFALQDTHNSIPSSSTKAERRRSLPARASMTSLNSEFSISTISTYASPQQQESSNFQNRRRRAAKLTQFFGVDYRDLMSEILDSIEKGVEEEGGRGALKPDEVQDLLQKLKKLKLKRNNLS